MTRPAWFAAALATALAALGWVWVWDRQAHRPLAGRDAMIIHVHGTPAPQGSKRHVGNGVMIESSEAVKPWREAVKWAAIDAAIDAAVPGLVRTPPMSGPVRLHVIFAFNRPKHHHRTGRNAHLLRDGAPSAPAGKPDLDKLLRSTLDALTDAGVWRDDSQVVRIDAVKVYTEQDETPGAHIIAEPEPWGADRVGAA